MELDGDNWSVDYAPLQVTQSMSLSSFIITKVYWLNCERVINMWIILMSRFNKNSLFVA